MNSALTGLREASRPEQSWTSRLSTRTESEPGPSSATTHRAYRRTALFPVFALAGLAACLAGLLQSPGAERSLLSSLSLILFTASFALGAAATPDCSSRENDQ